jgi:hypothetical protein
MTTEKQERIIAAYQEADLETDDFHSVMAAIQVDVPDADENEIAEALLVYATRTTKEAQIHTRWAEQQRKAGRPEAELT